MAKAYCMRCREMKEMKEEYKEKKSGREVLRGTCPKCGTKMCKFI